MRPRLVAAVDAAPEAGLVPRDPAAPGDHAPDPRVEDRVHGGALRRGREGGDDVEVHQASFSIRMAAALNSAVPALGSVASIVRRFVATSSG